MASGPLEALTSRPDLPWLRESVGLGSVVDATVRGIDVSRGLAELALPGAMLFAPADGLEAGTRVRVRIPASDVILATDVPRGLSVHNVLEGTVTRVEAGEGNVAIVQLAVGQTRLLAQVTVDAVSRLRVVEGARFHALVKSVSLQVP